MDRRTLSWILIAVAVLFGAAALSLWAHAIDTVSQRGGVFPRLHRSARQAMVCGGLAGAALGAGLLLRIERRERLPRPGYCACGYPLEERIGQCPECGRVRWRS